jgi:hypothetical protein
MMARGVCVCAARASWVRMCCFSPTATTSLTNPLHAHPQNKTKAAARARAGP